MWLTLRLTPIWPPIRREQPADRHQRSGRPICRLLLRVRQQLARHPGKPSEGAARSFQFAFEQSSNANGYNSWATKTTETLPDGSQNIVYSNYAGQPMLKVLQSGDDQWCGLLPVTTTTRTWCCTRCRRRVSGFDDTYADLLNNEDGLYQYLNDYKRA